MRLFQKGDYVEFIGGAIVEQVKFANTDFPHDLEVGKTYVIESVKIFNWYTKVYLVGVEGVYNSVHFHLLSHE